MGDAAMSAPILPYGNRRPLPGGQKVNIAKLGAEQILTVVNPLGSADGAHSKFAVQLFGPWLPSVELVVDSPLEGVIPNDLGLV
jgi:hypothetical protein